MAPRAPWNPILHSERTGGHPDIVGTIKFGLPLRLEVEAERGKNVGESRLELSLQPRVPRIKEPTQLGAAEMQRVGFVLLLKALVGPYSTDICELFQHPDKMRLNRHAVDQNPSGSDLQTVVRIYFSHKDANKVS